MRTISVTQALSELKLYDSKITKAISNAVFCGAAKKSSDKVGVIKKEDFDVSHAKNTCDFSCGMNQHTYVK